ncbi:MAG: redoxin domain-containing protein [Alphaproteobacteria bacterium]|nr:redoxin domain-containing protein [Alphaproteobacteria bacterium]
MPDLYESVLAEFEGQGLVSWLVNPGERAEVALEFVVEAGAPMPVLLDLDSALYSTYPQEPATPPFPVHVVIDREGVVRYLARSYDAAALREALREALEG